MEVAPESLAESKSWAETKSRKSIGSHGGESPSRKCIDGWTESTRRSGCGGLDAADGVNVAEWMWRTRRGGRSQRGGVDVADSTRRTESTRRSRCDGLDAADAVDAAE